MKELPAISVIIPLYNVEKYVAECLDSILAQTFQNFEVIVVDDCSTDSSIAVVENYAKKFGGRLTLEKLAKKSNGGGYIPRNKGLIFSRGEYIFFMDADDTITPTAFEELYTLAKKFNADVVHCEKFFRITDEKWSDFEYRKSLKPTSYLTGENKFIKAPTLLTDDLAQRVIFFSKFRLPWNLWLQLIRRDFLTKNDLNFADAAAQDMVFTMCEFCSAERYVLAPNVVNYRRVRENSVTTERIDYKQNLRKWTRTVRLGLHYLDDFLSRREFFSKRPDLKYMLFEIFTTRILGNVISTYQNVPAHVLDEILREEFRDDDNIVLTAFIFGRLNLYRVHLHNSFVRIAELENEIRRLKSNK